jgi:hypothetical protein
MKLIKTDKRSNLKPDTLESLLLAKQHPLDFNKDQILQKAIEKNKIIMKKLGAAVQENRLKKRKERSTSSEMGLSSTPKQKDSEQFIEEPVATQKRTKKNLLIDDLEEDTARFRITLENGEQVSFTVEDLNEIATD